MENCCRDTLRTIDNRMEAADALDRLLGVSTLVTWLGSNPIDVAFSMLTTDWSLIESAVRSVSSIARRACRDEAQRHALYHHNDPDEHRFWRQLADCFT